jgi:hypothetical protein
LGAGGQAEGNQGAEGGGDDGDELRIHAASRFWSEAGVRLLTISLSAETESDVRSGSETTRAFAFA